MTPTAHPTVPRSPGRVRGSWLLPAALLLAISACPAPAAAESGNVIDTLPFPEIAPQGITLDGTDGTFWVTSFLEPVITHLDEQGNVLGTIPSPFGPPGRPTGIAWYPLNDTLLVVNSIDARLIEIDKTGQTVGLDILLPVQPVPNPGGPVVRGIAVHPNGGSGAGSLYVVETVGAQIYEFDLFGFLIRSFDHPQDPDGFPGQGVGADAGGIELLLDAQGALTGIDLVGADNSVPEILRLDPTGAPTGYEIPLIATGAGTGGVGGIARKIVLDPIDMTPIEAVFGTSEAQQEIFIIDGSLPPIAQINDLVCTESIDGVTLSWLPGPGYDEIIVERNGEFLASLPGGSTGYADPLLPDGVFTYTVRGLSGTLSSDAVECLGVIGAGQVVAEAIVDGIQFGLDITEGGGLLWITTNEGVIRSYTKDLFLNSEFPAPFTGPDDDPAGIAYRSDTNTLLVVNAFDNMLQEIDLGGLPIGTPVLLDVPVPENDPTYLGALAYDPNGNGGLGALWATESETSLIHQLALDGTLLATFDHPDELFEPTPDPSFIDTFTLGISGVPEVGNGFEQIEIGGGTVFDRRMSRILRIDAATGSPSGFQVPLAGADVIGRARYWAHVNAEYLGETWTFALSLRSNQTRIFRLRRDPPPVAPVDFLRVEQPDLVDRAEISFTNHGPYDSIEIERDGVLIETLAGTATSTTDTNAVPGMHGYRVTPVTGGVAAAPRNATLRIGIGARIDRTFIPPAFSPYQMTRDASDGSFVVSSNSGGTTGQSLYRFAADGTFLGSIPAPENPPWLVAAMAVRPTPSGSEIWSITWLVPAPWLEPQEFHLWVQDTAGNVLSGPTLIDIPGAPVGVSLTYPSAMVHDPVTDSFWFLERNLDRFWRMNLAGQLVESFDHPQPPLQEYVFNLGLAYDPVRDAFTATSAGPFDTDITQAIGMSSTGHLTGTVIPLEDSGLRPLYGIARDGAHLFAVGSLGSIPQLVTLKAADPVDPPEMLFCEETAANEVTLTWTEPVPYDSAVVRRGGVEIAVVPGGTTNFVDVGVGTGTRVYTVAGTTIDGTSAPSVCSLVVAGLDPQFLRGDVTEDGAVDLADPIAILGYLFSGAAEPNCLDAADANDDGAVDLADAISLLGYLFTGGLPPASPFPTPGADPTGDPLGC